MASGMNPSSGHAVADDEAHIRHAIRTILTTPIGSRIMRREFGSILPDLIDHPSNQANCLRLQAATVMAILRWEPRVGFSSGSIVVSFAGDTTIDLNLVRRTGPRAGRPINLSVPLR